MERSIRFFGGTTQGEVTIENGHTETWSISRDVWFDRDIDGRWLVWAGRHESNPRVGGEDDEIGAIIVKDPQVAAFIDMLGELIANPAKFHHEPTFEPPRTEGTV